MSESAELAGAYRTFFKSNLGLDLVSRIDALYVADLKDATKASRDDAWALLNKAAGIDQVKDVIKTVQLLDQRGGGRA